eukprot:5567975-Prymnesium_polylepis.1
MRVGMLRARGPRSGFGTVGRLLLWRAWAAAPCSCAHMRDPCMGRRPRTDRDEHERARMRARGCRSGARNVGGARSIENLDMTRQRGASRG